jgi:hypothetical protein
MTITALREAYAGADDTEALFREAHERRRRRRQILSVAALLVAGAIFGTVGISGIGSGDTARQGAANHGRGNAVADPPVVLKSGQYYYTETERLTGTSCSPSYCIYGLGTVQTWVAPNGSGRQVTTTSPNPHFFIAADRTAWLAAGLPLTFPGLPTAVTRQEVGVGYAFTVNPSIKLFDMAGLPANATTLTKLIEKGRIEARGQRQTPLKGDNDTSNCETRSCIAFLRATDLLQNADLNTAAQRLALYKAMSRLPGVRTLGAVSDQIGRRGEGLRLAQHQPATTMTYKCSTHGRALPSSRAYSGKIQSTYRVHEPASDEIYKVIFNKRTARLLSASTSYMPDHVKAQIDPCFNPTPQESRLLPDWTLLLQSGIVGSDTQTQSTVLKDGSGRS